MKSFLLFWDIVAEREKQIGLVCLLVKGVGRTELLQYSNVFLPNPPKVLSSPVLLGIVKRRENTHKTSRGTRAFWMGIKKGQTKCHYANEGGKRVFFFALRPHWSTLIREVLPGPKKGYGEKRFVSVVDPKKKDNNRCRAQGGREAMIDDKTPTLRASATSSGIFPL